MAALSDYAENELLDHVLGTGAFPMPSIFIALYLFDPTDADVGTEVAGAGYARQAAAFTPAVNGQATNSAQITFPLAGADWGVITHIGLRDAAIAGNLIEHAQLVTPIQILINDQFQLDAGVVEASFD